MSGMTTRLSASLVRAFSGRNSSETLRGQVCAAALSITQITRNISDFSYVRPGPVPVTRHRVRWRESERYEVWKHETIPWVEPKMPSKSAGRLADFWEESIGEVEKTAETLQDGPNKVFYFVAAVKEALDKRGNDSILTSEEWASLMSPPSNEEKASLGSLEGRMKTLMTLLQQSQDLVSSAQIREIDAMESGEINLAVPLPKDTREKVQELNNKALFLQSLRLARTLSIITSVMDEQMTPHERAALRDLFDNASTGVDYVRLKSVGSFDKDPSEDVLRRELTPAQRANLNHFSTFEEERQDLLAHRDRAEVIPRKRLPTPLHADAPTRALEDVARVIDSNPSFTEEDKKYILQHYADAVTGKTQQAFDWSAEKKAIVDPQPQWGTYDPEGVKLQDDFVDAAKGQGKYSRMRGYTAGLEQVAPKQIGEVDSNPERRPLEPSEEVSLAMAAYDRDIKAKVEKITHGITAALGASLGVSVRSPAPEAAKDKGTAPASKSKDAVLTGVSAPADMSEEEAAKVVRSFFQKYLAGERLAAPQPPLDGPRKEIPAAPAPAPAKGKDKAKGKK